MKTKFKVKQRFILGALICSLCFCPIIPNYSFASAGLEPIKTISCGGFNGSISGKDITFEAGYSNSYAGTLSMENASISYDSVSYAAITLSAVFVNFPLVNNAGSGTTEDWAVTYSLKDDPTVEYTSTYKVTAKRLAKKDATFTGSVSVGDIFSKGYVFKATDFTNYYVQNEGKALGSVKLTNISLPVGSTLKNGGQNCTSGTAVSLSAIVSGSLVLTSTQKGTGTIIAEAYDADGLKAGDTLTINITMTAPTSLPLITKSVAKLGNIDFPGTDIITSFKSTTGADFKRLRFSGTSGKDWELRSGYISATQTGSPVATSTDYYTASLSAIKFIPSSAFAGSADVNYSAYDALNAELTGTVRFVVDSATIPKISYKSGSDGIIRFALDDFTKAFKDATGRELSRVRFSLPDSSKGTLYSKYKNLSDYGAAVKSSEDYYRTGYTDYLLGDVALIPKARYNGEFTIDYSAYDAAGNSFKGTVGITIVKGLKDLNALTYTIDQGEILPFKEKDFFDCFKESSGMKLSYVKFTPPDAAKGTLYVGYISEEEYGGTVGDEEYYYTATEDEELIKNIAFVPKKGYAGNFTIEYAAFGPDNDKYTGTIQIYVRNYGTDIPLITYNITKNEVLGFTGGNFNNEFQEKSKGKILDTLQFTTLPSSKEGTLYYKYINSSKYGFQVRTSDKFYRASALDNVIANVAFVPKMDFSGSSIIYYTARDEQDTPFTGVIKINVGSDVATPTPSRFTDVGESYVWAQREIEYLYNNGAVTGVSEDKFEPEKNIKRGDFVLMLCRALDLDRPQAADFSDVPVNSYYYNAISTARYYNIAQGSGNRFNPKDSVTREDAMVMIYRALDAKGKKLSTSGSMRGFIDNGSISPYAGAAVASLVDEGVIGGYSDSTFRPKENMKRAEMAVTLYRALML